MSAIIRPQLSDQERREPLSDERMKELIFEAMQIVSGDTMKLATNAHLKALLEERSNLVAMMSQTKDGLVNAVECLEGQEKEMALAHLRDLQRELFEAEHLERREAEWVRKILHGD